MTVDLDDAKAVRDQDPGGMVAAVGNLGSIAARGTRTVWVPAVFPTWPTCAAWSSAGWGVPRSRGTCCDRCSATGSACRSR